MAHPSQLPSNNLDYDPLPLTNNDRLTNSLYNVPQHSTENLYNHSMPPSPGPGSSFNTPLVHAADLPYEDIPVGAAQPRFLGRALYDDGPQNRESYASSSHQTIPSVGGGSEYNSSVYALNDTVASRGTSNLYDSYRDDPSDGSVPMAPMGGNRYLAEKNATYAAPREKSKRTTMILGILGAVILVIAVVAVAIYFAVIKPHSKTSTSVSSGGSTSGAATATTSHKATSTPKTALVTGGDGSQVTMDDGSTFTYSNKFGGYWYQDPKDPFNNGARAQSWSPALNETFNYGVDKIRGVNIGGWLVTEPFISPALFEPYLNNSTPAIDEWTLSQNMAADTANGGLNQLETHYKTFITEQDFAQIAGAGLNYVRIPIAYWAIEVRAGEPFLAKTSWTYFLKAIEWARKYGLRINLDLHALPGSQNGWNHSGRLGTIGVLNGPMGLANAQRSLDYIRIIAEFISQPQYRNVVTMFGITNEPQGSTVGQDTLSRYYLQAYNIVREASGTGQGNGPFVSFHDAFFSRDKWAGFLPNADRISLDSHPYLCFSTQSSAAITTYATTPCDSWAASVNTSMQAFGMTTAGEWSNAVTDCGLWVNGVNQGTRYEGTYAGSGAKVGTCDVWTNYAAYDQPTKDGLKQFAMASMDALQNWFFWTWKIGNSSVTGNIESPAWSYQLGLQQGWMPTDPRSAYGTCGNTSPWNPPLQAWQTGGAGAGNIAAAVTSSLAWPPTVISAAGAATLLPTYTPTGPVPTLPAPTFSVSPTPDAGNGWANSADKAGLMVQIPGCTYLDPWVDPGTAPPSPLCAAKRMVKRAPEPTPAPQV